MVVARVFFLSLSYFSFHAPGRGREGEETKELSGREGFVFVLSSSFGWKEKEREGEGLGIKEELSLNTRAQYC